MDLEQFYKVLPGVSALTISCSLKRDEGEWWPRFTWVVETNGNTYESAWFGFATLEEAFEDFVTHMETCSEFRSLINELETEPK